MLARTGTQYGAVGAPRIQRQVGKALTQIVPFEMAGAVLAGSGGTQRRLRKMPTRAGTAAARPLVARWPGRGCTCVIRRARVHIGRMRIRHLDMAPSVHPEAYVAPTAVLSGEVRIGRGSCIMHGAVLAAEGGPVEIGANYVIMENAVLRGTRRHPLIMGDHVLAGPHSP